MPRETAVSIEGASFLVNGRATYEGRTYGGMKVEGLLMNARLVQGTFDEGFQSVPVDWRISSDRKRGFLDLLAKVTGAEE